MGWEQKEIRLVGRVSRHNSDRDEQDDTLWREIQARIREIEDDPRYQGLILVSDGLGSDD